FAALRRTVRDRLPPGFGSVPGRRGAASTHQTCHHLGVRVHRSFAFIDLSGFTALTEAGGDENAVNVLSAFRTLVRNICSRRGVRIAKWLGDGAMLVGVETTPLLASVLEMEFAAERSPE